MNWDDEARGQLKNIIQAWINILKDQPELATKISTNIKRKESQKNKELTSV